ncbi:SDR family oxidoreductase [Frigoriglobus tundricola]|uniref:Short-chain dehydrogenase/reductase SDR n=1 Tax=Frigoriglobus tundricola TaxID=2774151 RepID=A0A6M5YJ22_9BACT|nr:SDR family oxidoreductase [Frigoriglobus tundricola]QJW93554.1 Short-chain dehydrogenase/reductase SDR [Frigoriglobus tundricola]
MSVSLKPLREQVIVITGASSGIGLATAQAAARGGARVVLAARNEPALAEIVRDIARAGGTAVHVEADVSRREDVEKIAQVAVARFGGFDTWVNNAGQGLYGTLEQVSEGDQRRLFDVNFWSQVYGSLVAVKHLKSRGGALINIGSVASEMAFPLLGMYAATKHAVKGFTESLRMELEAERAPISVTLVKPTGIDTPFPQHAKNYMDREPRLPDPVYRPEEVAAAVLQAATRPERDVYVGTAARVMSTVGRQVPRAMDRLGERVLMGQEVRPEAPRNPEGALYKPGTGGRVRGEHPGPVLPVSVYNRADRHPILGGLLLLGVAGAAVALLSGSSRR